MAMRVWRINPLDRLFNYSSVLVILQTYGITGMVHYLKVRDDGRADRFLLAADRHSFGIYLIHIVSAENHQKTVLTFCPLKFIGRQSTAFQKQRPEKAAAGIIYPQSGVVRYCHQTAVFAEPDTADRRFTFNDLPLF